MGINWVTFIAQLVNLFVLVWLLKRFLYRPILNAVDKRQADIDDKVRRAAEEYESAKADHAAIEKQRADFNREKQQLLDETAKEIDRLKKEQTTELAALKEKMAHKIQMDLERDKALTALKIRDFAGRHFIAVTEKLINTFTGLSPVEQATALFKKQLDTLSVTELKNVSALATAQGRMILRQSHALPKTKQVDLQKFIRKKLQLPPRFSIESIVDEELILGFELRIGDTVIEWHLKAFTTELYTNLNQTLGEA